MNLQKTSEGSFESSFSNSAEVEIQAKEGGTSLHKTIREVYKGLISFAPCEETIWWVVRPSVLVWTVDTEHSGYKTMEYAASFHVGISLLPHGLGTGLMVYLSLL